MLSFEVDINFCLCDSKQDVERWDNTALVEVFERDLDLYNVCPMSLFVLLLCV